MRGSKEVESWGRHYDTLLWTVTTIMAAAIGGLFVHVSRHFDVLLAIAGLIFTIIAVRFAASFRELRHKMAKHYGNTVKNILRQRRKFYQWRTYLSIFVVLDVLWMRLLIKNCEDFRPTWIAMGVSGVVLMMFWWYESK